MGRIQKTITFIIIMSERTKILDFPKSVVSPGTSGPAISARTDSITWPARHSRVERPNTSNWTLSVTSLATRRPVDGTVPGKAPDVRDICGRPGQWRCAVFGDFCARVHPNRLTCRLTVALASNVSYSELYMGPFCLTQSSPTHQLTEPTQPNPLQVEKFGPNPTQPNPIQLTIELTD